MPNFVGLALLIMVIFLGCALIYPDCTKLGNAIRISPSSKINYERAMMALLD